MKPVPVLLLLGLLICSGVYAQESAEIKHLEALANAGDYNAARRLATAYATGFGVPQDHDAANHWFSFAASRRNDAAVEACGRQSETRPYSFVARITKNEFNLTGPAANQSVAPARVDSQASSLKGKATSAWREVTGAVSAASDKTQQFLSDHTDEIEDLATFLIERYTGEPEAIEEPHGRSASKGSSHPEK